MPKQEERQLILLTSRETMLENRATAGYDFQQVTEDMLVTFRVCQNF